MKNLTIKKVALGLFLAGYAASSAFAALQKETANLISGNAPVLKSHAGVADKLTVDVFHADGSAYVAGDVVRVGDKVHIKYRLADLDGDTDTANAGKVKASLEVSGKDSSGNWAPISIPTVVSTYDATDPELGELVFEITNDFVGKSNIGFKVLAETEFGLPTKGKWVWVSDIFGAGDPAHGTNPPSNPGAPGDNGNPGGPGEGNIPGTNPGPIMPSGGVLGIFLVNSTGDLVSRESYTNLGSTLTPKYGERYAAIVWDDANSNGTYEAGETEFTSGFKFEWHVVGNGNLPVGTNGNIGGVPAESGFLTGDGNRAGTNDTIFLGSSTSGTKHNSVYSFSTHKAGIQGYQLQVKTL
ncbi:hypothetical protein GA0061081_10647 [Gilliamella bombicola]|uniref:Uncharacterized protein n=1 Tax=Gilliamella bombicola TaxID=1798182 RepID=A0A1C4BY22_9GAMM|nr:hypothetical protein [Gilliamella bombicola]SCC11633.1 hypothetical protein GA0061081_10647 [Gilliamella bombicola]